MACLLRPLGSATEFLIRSHPCYLQKNLSIFNSATCKLLCPLFSWRCHCLLSIHNIYMYLIYYHLVHFFFFSLFCVPDRMLFLTDQHLIPPTPPPPHRIRGYLYACSPSPEPPSVLVTIGNYKKHPIFRAFLGNLSRDYAPKYPPFPRKWEDACGPPYAFEWGGWAFDRWFQKSFGQNYKLIFCKYSSISSQSTNGNVSQNTKLPPPQKKKRKNKIRSCSICSNPIRICTLEIWNSL